MIVVEDLSVTVAGGATLLEPISLEVPEGGVTALRGPSGCGKSTLMRALLGRIPAGAAAAGTVRVGGHDVLDLDAAALRRFRREQIAFVGQDPGVALNPTMRVRSLLGELADHTRSLEALSAVELPESYLRRRAAELSGGEQRRIALARALARRTPVLVLDEPLAGLHGRLRTAVVRLLRRLSDDHGTTVVISGHNTAALHELTDHQVMVGGELLSAIESRSESHRPRGVQANGSADRAPYPAMGGSDDRTAAGTNGHTGHAHGSDADFTVPGRGGSESEAVQRPEPEGPQRVGPEAVSRATAAADGPRRLRGGESLTAASDPEPDRVPRGTAGDRPGEHADDPVRAEDGDGAGLGGVRAEGEGGLGAVRAEGEVGLGGVRAEGEVGLGGVRAEGEADLGGVRAEGEGGLSGVRGEGEAGLSAMRAEDGGEADPGAAHEMNGRGIEVGGNGVDGQVLSVSGVGVTIGRRHVLADIDLRLGPGEALAVAGPSGAGKSTLARAVVGLRRPVAGTVRVDGRVALVPQDSMGSLNPRRTVAQTLSRPLRRHRRVPRSEMAESITDLLRTVELNPELAQRYPHELSGGQRQRVALARALTLDPAALVCDEITSALDHDTATAIMTLLDRLRRDRQLALLVITHDMDVVSRYCTRMSVLESGRIVESGPIPGILTAPTHDATLALLG